MARKSLLKRAGIFFALIVSRLIGPFVRRRIPLILMYHSVAESDSRMSVSPAVFEKQMSYLASRGFRCRSTLDLLDRQTAFEKKDFILHFDDGFADNLTLADPILARHGMHATIFAAAGHLGGLSDYARDEGNRGLRLMNEEELRQMSAREHLIGNHFYSHENLTELSKEDVTREYRMAKEVLDRALNGEAVSDIVAYPRSKTNQGVADVMKEERVRLGFTVSRKPFTEPDYPFRIPRIEVDANTSFSEFKLYAAPAYPILRSLFRR